MSVNNSELIIFIQIYYLQVKKKNIFYIYIYIYISDATVWKFESRFGFFIPNPQFRFRILIFQKNYFFQLKEKVFFIIFSNRNHGFGQFRFSLCAHAQTYRRHTT